MEIQQAQFIDLAEILALQKKCYQENALRYNDFHLQPLLQTLAEVETEFAMGIILKMVERSTIIGSIRAFEKDETCYIGKVIVHPDFQNKGIGVQLMSAMEDYFLNIHRFELYTGFRDDKNLYFYNKLGYKPFKREQVKDNFAFIYFEKFKIDGTN